MTNMNNTGTSKQPNSNPVPDWEPEDDASSLHSDCNSHHNDDHTAGGAPSSPSVKKNDAIAKKEDTAVNYLRLVVLFVLVSAAVGVSLAVYFYLHHAEQSTFEDQFESDASKIFAAIGTTLDNTLGPADALIVNVLAYAKATNQTMPFVTLPSYGLQAAKLLRIAKSFQIQWSMYVQPEELNEWRDYANRTHPEFVDYALDIMESDPQWSGLLYKNYSQTQCYDIFTWGGVPVTEPIAALGFFGPNWMEYPIMSGASGNGGCPYNYDHGRLEVLAQAILFMMHHQKAVIGNFPTVNFDESDPEQALQKKILADYVSQFVGPEIDPSEPYTQLAFPILDHSLESLQVNTSERQTVHGHVALNIQFRSWIENVLPEQSNGLIMVVDQGLCGVPFTFRMDGAHVTFLGTGTYMQTFACFLSFLLACLQSAWLIWNLLFYFALKLSLLSGDQHEAKYDDMVRTQVLEELMDTTREMDRQSTYTGPPVSPDFCPNTLKIYPSQDMQDNHLTDSPAILAAVVACIFFFTSFVFLLYDVLVAKRQRVVMSRALESGAIVSSLFPEEVREKLYEENRQRFQNEQQVKMFQRRQTTEVSSNNSDSTNDIGSRGPPQIAKLYPHTTIFFGKNYINTLLFSLIALCFPNLIHPSALEMILLYSRLGRIYILVLPTTASRSIPSSGKLVWRI